MLPMALLGLLLVGMPLSAQEQDPLLRAIAVHGGSAVETIVRIQMRGQSSNGQPVTISASLVGNDANSLRVDYGRPIAKSFINTPQGAVEVTTGGRTVWKPTHVGAFAQLDILSVLGIQHLATPLVQRTIRGTDVVEGRASTRVGALTERTKKVFRRTVTDGVDVLVDQASGVVVEIIRRQPTEKNLDATFLAGFRFSDYRTVQGILLPYRIQRVMNGVVVETMTFDTIDLNPPLTNTFFKAPANHTIPRVIGRRP
jgi:hypothetical protein